MKRLSCVLLCGALLWVFACTQKPTAESVISKVIEASGGADKLEAIQDQVSTWDFAMEWPMPAEAETHEQPEGKMMSMPMVCTYKRPNKLMMEFLGPDGSVAEASCYDGKTGWTLHEGQRQEMNETQMKSHAELASTWVDGFLHYKEKGYTAALMPNETLDGKECYVIEMTDKDGKKMKYYIDAGTYHIIRQTGEMLNFQNEWEPMYLVMNNYKMVDGVAMAHHVAQYHKDGKLLWEANLKEVKNNTGVDDAKFSAEITMK